jgi:bacteriocin-like protein
MRELNEQELEQVVGGSDFTFIYVAQEQAGGTAIAGNGIAFSKSSVASTHGPDSSSSFAANKGFAYGSSAAVQSAAISTSSVTITGN